jgi:hypothetical protein
MHAISIRWPCPREQKTGLKLGKASPSHPFGNQSTFIFGNCTADLQKELIMRILAHGPIEKLDFAADLGELVDQQHLVNVIASETIGSGEQHAIQFAIARSITEAVKARSFEGRTTVAVVAEDVSRAEGPTLSLNVALKAVELLVNRLEENLVGGRDSDIHSYSHGGPPVWVGALMVVVPSGSLPSLTSIAGGGDTLDPIAVVHSDVCSWFEKHTTVVSSAPP